MWCRMRRIPDKPEASSKAPRRPQAWSDAAAALQHAGFALSAVSLPTTKAALAAYYILAPSEAARRAAFGAPRAICCARSAFCCTLPLNFPTW